MPFSITGGRYASASLSSVGTTTVTVSTTPFVQSDFSKSRLVGLWGLSNQIVSNPGFDTDTNWTKGGGVSIGSGVVTCTNAAGIISQASPSLIAGRSYIISFSYTKTAGAALRVGTGITDGQVIIYTSAGLANGSGTITFNYVPIGNVTGIVLGASGAVFSGTIDNFTVTEGALLKGVSWARRWVSTSQIELEKEFFDPATGNVISQVIGDQILISKDFSESVTTGLTVSGRVVTISDTCTFGSDNNQLGVCFYDENKLINSSSPIILSGGLTVFGKLDDYASNIISSSIDIESSVGNSILCNNGSANFLGYGGRWNGAYFIGGNNQGNPGYTIIINGVESANDFLTNGAGANWAYNPSRHQLINCYGTTSSGNAILRRWGNGIIRGGRYKITNASDNPISIFGSDSAGTYTVAAPAGERAIVLDMGGTRPALVRASSAVAITFNFTNLITTDFRSVQGQATPLVANNSGINTFRFSDLYTGLQAGTVGVVLNNSGVVADSVASSGTSWSPSLLRRTCVGATVTINATSWTYGFKRYGSNPVSGSITPTTYDLGAAGSADNVVFGGIVTQLADNNVTLTQAQAAALTQIDTLDQLYDAAIEWAVRNVTNAQYPSISTYPVIASGTVLNLGSRNLVVDATAAAAFAVNTSTNTITIKSSALAVGSKFSSFTTTGAVTLFNGATIGCIYTSSAGTSAQLILSGLTSGSSVLVTNGSGSVVEYVASSGTSYTLNIAPAQTGTWTWRVARYGFQTASGTFTPGSGGQTSVNVSLIPDGFVVDTQVNVAAYTDLNTAQRIYDRLALYATTQAGMLAGQIATRGFGTLTVPAGLVLDPSAGSIIAASSGVVTAKCSGLSEDVTILSSGNFTQGAATLSNDVKIRAANLDSEIVASGITSITLYPSETDQIAATNAGSTFTSILRFKYGATVNGVLMGGTEYARINVSGTVLLQTFTVAQGRTTLDLGTAGQLAAINASVSAINPKLEVLRDNIELASKSIPATIQLP